MCCSLHVFVGLRAHMRVAACRSAQNRRSLYLPGFNVFFSDYS